MEDKDWEKLTFDEKKEKLLESRNQAEKEKKEEEKQFESKEKGSV